MVGFLPFLLVIVVIESVAAHLRGSIDSNVKFLQEYEDTVTFLCDFMDSTDVADFYSQWNCDEISNSTNPSSIYCSWTGLICDGNGEIWELWFTEGISGFLPESVGNLQSMGSLYLFDTDLSGTLPASIGNWNLWQFALSNNLFTGTLPDSIGSWTNLMYVYVIDNHFSGQLPNTIGNWNNALSLYMYENSFSGTIPPSLGNLKKVSYVLMHSNGFTGTLPPELGTLSSLFALGLGSNKLTGTIPASIINCTTLANLYLNDNHLTGTVPSIRPDDAELLFLFISDNLLGGSLYESVKSFNSLIRLFMWNNVFTGTIPEELCNNDRLYDLRLSGNPLRSPLCYPACLNLIYEDFYWFTSRCYGIQDEVLCDLATALDVSKTVNRTILTSSQIVESDHFASVESYFAVDTVTVNVPGAFKYELLFSQSTDAPENSVSWTSDGQTVTMVPGKLFYVVNNDILTIHSEISYAVKYYGYKVLVTAYYRKTGWMCENTTDIIDNSMRMFATDYCQWSGIHCLFNSIDTITLDSLGLRGTLPSSLGHLVSLTSLDLSQNFISGTIPSSYGQLLDLTNLDLSFNKLHGSVPNSFSNLMELNRVSLSNNNISGMVPGYLAGFDYIVSLNLDSNNFEGKLLQEFCRPQSSNYIPLHVTLLNNPELTCYEGCWSEISDSLFVHDESLVYCAPSSYPTSTPSSPSSMPSMSPVIDIPTNRLPQSTVIGIAVGFSVFGVFIGLIVYLFMQAKHKKVAPTELDIELAAMLNNCPIHKAIINGYVFDMIWMRENLSSANEVTPDGKTALDLILDRGSKYPLSSDVVFILLENSFPQELVAMKMSITDGSIENPAWSRIVQQNDKRSIEVVDQLLVKYKQYASVLANATDSFGRRAVNIASSEVKNLIQRKLFLHQRYELFEGQPEHKTGSSLVRFAFDHERMTMMNGIEMPTKVALKFLNGQDFFHREINNRLFTVGKSNNDCIIAILEQYDGMSDDPAAHAFREDAIVKGYRDYPYCIVLEAAEQNLQRFISSQHIANNWEEIRIIFKEIVTAVGHLHDWGVIHGDLKPTNLVRVGYRSIKIIDLDASSSTSNPALAGAKISTAYAAPELLYLGTDGVACPRVPGVLNSPYACVSASTTQDMWSLGALLYMLCTGCSLVSANIDDNVADPFDLLELAKWESSFSDRKLIMVSDPLARNLLSLLLHKSPEKRLTAARVLHHPFLTGKQVTRLVGEAAKYDVFISYRVDSDKDIAEDLYNALNEKEIRVWWDKKCLASGKNWQEGFCTGLLSSAYFVCLVSEDAVTKKNTPKQNFITLNQLSNCDNVLLEWMLALELHRRDLLSGIFPVFIGPPPSEEAGRYFPPVKEMPDLSVTSVEEKLRGYLDDMGCGLPYRLNYPVKSVVQEVLEKQGAFLSGADNETMEDLVHRIVKMVRPSERG